MPLWDPTQWCVRHSPKGSIVASFLEVSEAIQYQRLAAEVSSTDVTCAHVGNLAERTAKAIAECKEDFRAVARELSLEASQFQKYYTTPQGRYDTKCAWVLNGVMNKESYAQMERAAGKSKMHCASNGDSQDLEVNALNINLVSELYGLEYLGRPQKQEPVAAHVWGNMAMRSKKGRMQVEWLCLAGWDTTWKPSAV